MIAGFFKRLSAGAEQGLSAADERLALTALLVRIARADEDYSESEATQIDKVLMDRYRLSPFEATALRREGETVEADAPDTVRFTRDIKDAVPHRLCRTCTELYTRFAISEFPNLPTRPSFLKRRE